VRFNTRLLLFTDGQPDCTRRWGLPSLHELLAEGDVHFAPSLFSFGFGIGLHLMEASRTPGRCPWALPDATVAGTVFVRFMATAQAHSR